MTDIILIRCEFAYMLNLALSASIENAERVRDLYPNEYNFKYFTRLQTACSYQGKLQTKYAALTFSDFKRRVI